MPNSLTQFIAALKATEDSGQLQFNCGIERETLRVKADGNLDTSAHPAFLGSKLTHPLITTDFSESQLELITGVHTSGQAALKELDEVHRFIYSGLDDEVLWSSSMPCVLLNNTDIPLAYYGDSHVGRRKTIYRAGLGNRYGRSMQTICAVHYNFSFPQHFWAWLKAHEKSDENDQEFQNRRYFDLMRNFRRFGWLLTYLFGASPAVCKSFVRNREHNLDSFDESTAYLPNATSLRSGSLGYQSDAQSHQINICYNSLYDYVKSLAEAIVKPYPPYELISKNSPEAYPQLSSNILQSEAEFYSSIRAKRVPAKGQNFLHSLRDDGVQYIEVRLLDVNPYLPLGIDESEISFIDTFLTYCLGIDSPSHNDILCQEVTWNTQATVRDGRAMDIMLTNNGVPVSLNQWSNEIINDVMQVAELLDEKAGTTTHVDSVKAQQVKLNDASDTPSGKILSDMRSGNLSFYEFAMQKSIEHRAHFGEPELSTDRLDYHQQLAAASLNDQLDIEEADTGSFDDYLRQLADQYTELLN